MFFLHGLNQEPAQRGRLHLHGQPRDVLVDYMGHPVLGEGRAFGKDRSRQLDKPRLGWDDESLGAGDRTRTTYESDFNSQRMLDEFDFDWCCCTVN